MGLIGEIILSDQWLSEARFFLYGERAKADKDKELCWLFGLDHRPQSRRARRCDRFDGWQGYAFTRCEEPAHSFSIPRSSRHRYCAHDGLLSYIACYPRKTKRGSLPHLEVQWSTMPFYRFHVDVEATPLVVAERLKAIVRDRAGFWESFRMAWQSRDPSAPP